MTSLRTKILSSKLIMVILAVLIIGSLGYWQTLDALREVQRDRLEFVAQSTGREIERLLGDYQNLLKRIESLDHHSVLRPSTPPDHFARYEEIFPLLAYLNREGTEVVKSVRGKAAPNRRAWGHSPLYREALANPDRVVVSPVMESSDLQEPVIHLMLARHHSQEGELADILLAAVPVSSFSSRLAEKPIGKSGFSGVVTGDGRLLTFAEGQSAPSHRIASRHSGDGPVRLSLRGEDCFVVFTPILGTDWQALAAMHYREFMLPPHRLRLLTLAGVFTLLAAGLLFSLVFAGRLTRSVRQIIEHTELIAQGDFSRKLDISSGDELEVLARSFNTMTERLQRATAGKDSLHNILQSIIDPLVVAGGDGRITGVNPSVAKILNCSGEDLIGRPMAELFPEGEPIFRGSGFQRVLENGPIRDYETQVRTCGGKNVPVLFSCSLTGPDENGRPGMVGIIKDITDRREAEIARIRALREAEEARDKIDAILKSVVDALLVTDIDGRIVLMNPAAEDLLGTTLIETWQQPIEAVIREKSLREHLLSQLTGRCAESPEDLEIFDHRRQEMRVFQSRTAPVESRDRLITGQITTLRDVTHERHVDRLKSEFISTAAHELRTPLTSIIGYSEFLMYPQDFGGFGIEQQREFLAEIFEKANVLSKIVNELLDISRIESGQAMPLDRTLCCMKDIVEKVVRNFCMHSPGHRFEVDLDDPGAQVWLDGGKFVQVLENLLSNAVKYSPDGGLIRIASYCRDNQVRISVEDQGIGMTEEQVARVFDKFYRVDSSNTAIGGLGLGMSIVRSIITAHGGNIWVTSTPGAGTTVTFIIPGTDLDFDAELPLDPPQVAFQR